MSEFVRPCCISSVFNERYERIKNTFIKVYAKEPLFCGRAPGRVNLIGEHIDYCGYAVLPMAIEQDIVIAVTHNADGKLRLSNTDSRYESIEINPTNYDIDRTKPQWYHYFLCGYRGILEHFGLTGSLGLDILLDGTIPHCAGLSSSSALVCCAALITMNAYEKQISRLELAEICQHCERYIGTEGGGMDQSISFLAQKGTAKLIEFNPIRSADVTLPDGAIFVISNSCVEMNKAATDHFNVRVAECRLASQVLAKLSGLDWRSIRRLVDVQLMLRLDLDDALALVNRLLINSQYSKQQICEILEVSESELEATSLSERSRHVEVFNLRDRALHVYGEAQRVLQFKSVCEHGGTNALNELGELMYASHRSCRDLYECSCTDLDRLVELAMQNGAIGSRLTGAGWGGCAVSLVAAGKLDEFMSAVRQKYYAVDPCLAARVTESLFASEPADGAAIYVF
jgi:N-acetylgalactosamine kinase